MVIDLLEYPTVDQILDRRHCIPHVQPVDIHIVRVQALEAGFERLKHVLALVAAGVGVALARLSIFDAPQPHVSPNVIVPSADISLNKMFTDFNSFCQSDPCNIHLLLVYTRHTTQP